MANEEVMEALWQFLLERVYPNDPSLVRNDAKAAEIVCEKVYLLRCVHDEYWGRDLNKVPPRTRRLVEAYFSFRSLSSLSKPTVRKYIGELWSMGMFDECIHFGFE